MKEINKKTKKQMRPDANIELFTAIQITIFQKGTAVALIQV